MIVHTGEYNMINRLELAYAVYHLNMFKARSRVAQGEYSDAAIYFDRAHTALQVIQSV